MLGPQSSGPPDVLWLPLRSCCQLQVAAVWSPQGGPGHCGSTCTAWEAPGLWWLRGGSGGPRAPARTERGEQGLPLRTQGVPDTGEASHVAGPFLDGTLAAWLCAQNLELGVRGSRAGPAPGDTGGDGRTVLPWSPVQRHTQGAERPRLGAHPAFTPTEPGVRTQRAGPGA